MFDYLQYLKYKILTLKSVGIEKKIYHEKKNRIKNKILFKKMGPLAKSLQKLENYQAYHKYYLIFKQRYNIEIPADVCGSGNKFELIKIKLKDIRRQWIDNSIIPLTKCAPYQYLKCQKTKIYLDYLKEHHQIGWLPENSLAYSLERFKKLYQTIKKEGYNPQKSVIDKRNCICDGLHRSCILMYLKGEDYEIPVVQVSQDFESN